MWLILPSGKSINTDQITALVVVSVGKKSGKKRIFELRAILPSAAYGTLAIGNYDKCWGLKSQIDGLTGAVLLETKVEDGAETKSEEAPEDGRSDSF